MTAFGCVLKELRQQKRLSQMSLALEAEVSSRHISFMENGRSKPSRDMVLHLSNILDVSSRDTNLLLSSAGFTQEYSESELSDEKLKDVRSALSYMMDAHDPYPAIVVDREWNLLMANRTYMMLTNYFLQQGASFPDTTNVMDVFFHPDGYRLFVKNWEDVAIFLLRRIYREHLASLQRDMPNSLLDRILMMPGIPKDWKVRPLEFAALPMVKVEIEINSLQLALFSTISTFGTALDVTLQDLRVEHYFPGDEHSKAFFTKLASEYQ